MFYGLLKSLTRVTSFIGKEVTEVVRQPAALFSLVLGPFLIMALFGIGYSGQRRPLTTVLALPTSVNLSRDPAAYKELGGEAVRLVEVTDQVESSRERLRRGEIDLLVVIPEFPEQQLLSGQQAVLSVEYSQIDPVRDNYARFVAYRQVQELNRMLLETSIGEAQGYVVQLVGQGTVVDVPSKVLAAPTRADTKNWAPLQPTVSSFFAPAVLALVLQHMAVTLTALSLVRERLSGAIEIFRVAPVRTLEILLGKYAAFGFFNLSIGALLTFLMVGPLGVPLLGDPGHVAGVVLLLTFASLGLGLLISTVVDSERQAVQLSMLVLLASVFFSGFLLPLDEFLLPVQWVAYALPVTHGIRLLQETMLRGAVSSLWEVWTLVAVGGVLFLVTTSALRRSMARA